jgi:hypothetical protein
MPLTEKQRNVVVLAYYVAMLDMLATIAGITMGAGKEGNPMFAWITSSTIMFIAMFLANIIVFIGIITYLNIINERDTLMKHRLPEIFTNLLLITCGFRFYSGPLLWLLAMCGVSV